MRASTSIVLTGAALALSATASADTPPPAGQTAIKELAGSWSGAGTITSEGKTHKVAMTWDCVAASDGAGTRCHGVITGLPGFTYVFDDLWGYSAADGLVHWFTVTNAGEVHDHRGHLDASGGLVSVDVPNEGKVLNEVISFKRKNGSMTMSWVVNVGGTERERGKIKLNRK
jgi:hypothetical protein